MIYFEHSILSITMKCFVCLLFFLTCIVESYASDKLVYGAYSKNRDNKEFIAVSYQILETDTTKTINPFVEIKLCKPLFSAEIEYFMTYIAGLRIPIYSDSSPSSIVNYEISLDIGAGISIANVFTDRTIHSVAGMIGFIYTFHQMAGFKIGLDVLPDFEYTGKTALPVIGLFLKI